MMGQKDGVSNEVEWLHIMIYYQYSEQTGGYYCSGDKDLVILAESRPPAED